MNLRSDERWWQIGRGTTVLISFVCLLLVPTIARSQTTLSKLSYRRPSQSPAMVSGQKTPEQPTPAKRYPVRQAQQVAPLPPPRSLAPRGGAERTYEGPPSGINEEETGNNAVLGSPKPMPPVEESTSPAEESLPMPGTSGSGGAGRSSGGQQSGSGTNPPATTAPGLRGPSHYFSEEATGSGIELAPGEMLVDPTSNDPHLNPILAHEHFELGVAKLSPYKKGFFQKLSLSGAFLGSGSEDNLNMTELESFAMFGLPFPITEWPLVLSPGYNMHLLSRPSGGTDLPPRLNDAYLDIMWLPTFVHRYTTLLAVTPGYYSDYRIGDADAFRITGKGLVIYDAVPEKWQLVGGVVYLGRDSLKILPVGGAIWTPNDWVKLELIFPKPKLAAMFNRGMGYEDWTYLMADYGGNTYSIRRANGDADKVTLQDFRIIGGIERRLDGGAGYRLEAGYIFGRRVDYLYYGGDFEPQDTFLVRAGITF